jgi:GWxTD domain-containing protein
MRATGARAVLPERIVAPPAGDVRSDVAASKENDIMPSRSARFAILLAATLLVPGLATAQKLDKNDRAWLDEVRPILLAEEEKTYRSLKEKADRLEFQKIFWARRDPDLATPENEYQARYREARATADREFRVPGRAGSTTDCGRVFILLGKPDEVHQEDAGMSSGLRAAETWTYRDNAERTFQGGRATIAFDAECRAPVGLAAQMDRVAASTVVQPNIDYRVGKDGRLTGLAELLPKDTAARALFRQPREEFATAIQTAYLKVADGSTALLGLVRGEAAGLPVIDSGGRKTVELSVAASAVGEDGREAAWTEQTTGVPLGEDGAFVASFKLGLRPGRYTLKAGAVDVKGGKASLATTPIEVPDLSKVEPGPDGTEVPVATTSSVLVVRAIEDLPEGASDPRHPYAALELGRARLVPLFGGQARQSEQVEVFYQVYDLAVDPGTGQADAVALVSILKDGKTPVAKAPENPIQTAFAGSSVGPIPLAGFEPGKYVVRLKVTDRLAKREVVEESPLVILAQ